MLTYTGGLLLLLLSLFFVVVVKVVCIVCGIYMCSLTQLNNNNDSFRLRSAFDVCVPIVGKGIWSQNIRQFSRTIHSVRLLPCTRFFFFAQPNARLTSIFISFHKSPYLFSCKLWLIQRCNFFFLLFRWIISVH